MQASLKLKTRSPSESFPCVKIPAFRLRPERFFYGRKAGDKIVSFILHCCGRSIAVMNSEFIRLWDVLEIMDSVDAHGKPVRFQVKYVTANRTTKEGGEIIELKDACKCSVKTRKGEEIFPEKKHFHTIERISKDPRHWTNSTRNILLPNGQKRKLHIRLIIEFNHKRVCY